MATEHPGAAALERGAGANGAGPLAGPRPAHYRQVGRSGRVCPRQQGPTNQGAGRCRVGAALVDYQYREGEGALSPGEGEARVGQHESGGEVAAAEGL